MTVSSLEDQEYHDLYGGKIKWTTPILFKGLCLGYSFIYYIPVCFLLLLPLSVCSAIIDCLSNECWSLDKMTWRHNLQNFKQIESCAASKSGYSSKLMILSKMLRWPLSWDLSMAHFASLQSAWWLSFNLLSTPYLGTFVTCDSPDHSLT